jgi:hypothetical protein
MSALGKVNDEFLRRFTESEEEARLDPCYRWNGGNRWFASPNVVDLERHRSREDMRRMARLAYEQWASGSYRWPPSPRR